MSIAYPDASAATLSQRQQARQLFESRGYVVREGVGKNQIPTLELHHLGDGTKVTSLWRELGVAGGTAKLLSRPSLLWDRLTTGVGSTVKWLDTSLHDPARANGVINIAAEIFLMSAGGGTKEGNWKTRKNFLQTIAGIFFFGQSALYALVAKGNDDVALDHLKNKLDRVSQNNGDVPSIRYETAVDKDEDSLLHSLTKFVRRYPVQIGATLNDLGMIAYIGHARAQKKWDQAILGANTNAVINGVTADAERQAKAKNYVSGGFLNGGGFLKDIIGASLSLLAWPLLLLPRKPRDEAALKNEENNIFASSWNKFREDPEIAAGLLTLAASSSRLMGAEKKENTKQIIGESIYIGGDLALMFTKNDEYGGEKTKNISVLAEKIALYVNSLPQVFGPESQKTFVANIAEYLKQKGLEEVGGKPERDKLTHADLDERAAHLTQAVMKKIGAHDHFDRLADKTVELIQRFPKEQQPMVQAALAAHMAQLPWVHASDAEITKAIQSSPLFDDAPDPKNIPPKQMHDLTKEVTELLGTVPGIDAGGAAVAIQRALAPFIEKQRPTTQVNSSAHQSMLQATPDPLVAAMA